MRNFFVGGDGGNGKHVRPVENKEYQANIVIADIQIPYLLLLVVHKSSSQDSIICCMNFRTAILQDYLLLGWVNFIKQRNILQTDNK